MSEIFGTVPFTAAIMPNFLCALTKLFPLELFLANLIGFFLQGPPEDRGR